MAASSADMQATASGDVSVAVGVSVAADVTLVLDMVVSVGVVVCTTTAPVLVGGVVSVGGVASVATLAAATATAAARRRSNSSSSSLGVLSRGGTSPLRCESLSSCSPKSSAGALSSPGGRCRIDVLRSDCSGVPQENQSQKAQTHIAWATLFSRVDR